jgi:4-hydroxy-tetrahydrodipicolinate reductase
LNNDRGLQGTEAPEAADTTGDRGFLFPVEDASDLPLRQCKEHHEMDTIIFGTGGLGRAAAAALVARGDAVRLVGRPMDGRHEPAKLAGADVIVEASRGDAVKSNLEVGLEAGCRRFVIGTTDWAGDRAAVDELLIANGAAAVVASNFSPGVALFGRLVETATTLFGPLPDFDPYLVEWHRRTKSDRPSGTARDLAARMLAVHPRKTRISDGRGGPAPDELEVAAVRAGANPGTHLVGFDASGETLEIKLTSRDRSAYAAGIVASVEWLMRQARKPGIHAFDPVVVDELLAGAAG